jgi:predicted esterase
MKKVLAALVVLAFLPAATASDLETSLRSTAAQYLAKIASIAPIAGRDTTYDYYERLIDDAALLRQTEVPQGYTATQWSAAVNASATLDLSLATQLLMRSYRSMASIRGLGESLVRSSKDGTMLPVTVYVPSSYTTGRPAPLIVFLHGRGQSESQLLAPPYIAHLAESTGTIVVAPWGRGYYDFRQSASDVYDALDAAVNAFNIDPRKRYLVGYSMGGFSVFEVAPDRPNAWSAVMCIAGALLGSDAQRVVAMMRTTPFYVLTGTDDQSIPTRYPSVTAAYLNQAGLDVSFYSQPGGIHRLITLLPILAQAWSDMEHQIVRPFSLAVGNLRLPSSPPPMSLRP